MIRPDDNQPDRAPLCAGAGPGSSRLGGPSPQLVHGAAVRMANRRSEQQIERQRVQKMPEEMRAASMAPQMHEPADLDVDRAECHGERKDAGRRSQQAPGRMPPQGKQASRA